MPAQGCPCQAPGGRTWRVDADESGTLVIRPAMPWRASNGAPLESPYLKSPPQHPIYRTMATKPHRRFALAMARYGSLAAILFLSPCLHHS
jgi:hypothetical protein